jgi:hypothetical protein
MPRAAHIRLLAWGAHAARFVRRHDSARVAAVFARSLYLQAGADFLCIGAEGIGLGPLNATVQTDDWERFASALPAPGDRADLGSRDVMVGRAVFDTTGALSWSPPAWPARKNGDDIPQRLAATLRALHDLVRERAPGAGLVRATLGLASQEDGDPAVARLRRTAGPRIAALAEWMQRRLQGAVSHPAPVDLLGLGPGLTPSGDDLLGGALIALRAIGRADAVQDLDWQIASEAAGATTPLSCAFLRAAADGLGCASLHGAIAALLEDDRSALAGDVDALGRIGHTSGWDALAGAALALQAAVAARTPAPAQ